MISITATELKENLSQYLALSQTQDVYITKNGQTLSILSNPYRNRLEMAQSLFGIIPDTMTLEESKDKRCHSI